MLKGINWYICEVSCAVGHMGLDMIVVELEIRCYIGLGRLGSRFSLLFNSHSFHIILFFS